MVNFRLLSAVLLLSLSLMLLVLPLLLPPLPPPPPIIMLLPVLILIMLMFIAFVPSEFNTVATSVWLLFGRLEATTYHLAVVRRSNMITPECSQATLRAWVQCTSSRVLGCDLGSAEKSILHAHTVHSMVAKLKHSIQCRHRCSFCGTVRVKSSSQSYSFIYFWLECKQSLNYPLVIIGMAETLIIQDTPSN